MAWISCLAFVCESVRTWPAGFGDVASSRRRDGSGFTPIDEGFKYQRITDLLILLPLCRVCMYCLLIQN